MRRLHCVKGGKELVLQSILSTVTIGGGVNCSANRNWLVIQTNMQAESHTSPLLQQPYLPVRYYHCVTPVESKLDILNYQDILQGCILYRPLDL